MTEKQIIDLVLAQHPMMFRNAVGWGIATSPKAMRRTRDGKILLDHGSPIRYGLFPGSGDMIGYKTVTITPDMVGQKIAVFQSIEIKTKGDRLRGDQRNWNRALLRDGAIAEVWRDTGKTIEVVTGVDIT